MNAPTRPHESTALATVSDAPPSYDLSPMQSPGNTALILDPRYLANMTTIANAMATAKVTVPQHLQGKAGDCLAVVMQATQWGMNPFAVAQKTHIVNGTLGYEAQLVHAVLQASGAIQGTFKYEHEGEGNNLKTRVGAVCAGDSDLTWGEWLAASSVTTKNSPLWKTNPKQQMGYLQVKNWARAYKPGAILGVYTTDELAENQPKNMGAAEVVQPPAPPATYPADQFAKNLPAWSKVIEAGRKTADQIIAMAETKFPLTEEQKQAVRAVGQPPEQEQPQDVQPKVSFAQVADKLNAASTRDELDEAATLIEAVTENQRAELHALYEQRQGEVA